MNTNSISREAGNRSQPSFTRRILVMMGKDLRLEWRQKYAVYGLLLYLSSAVFAIHVLQDKPDADVWNALYWIIVLFVSVNAVAKSFLQESRERQVYYFTLHHPVEIMLSKLLYNVLLMMGMSLISLFLFILLLDNPVIHFPLFLLMVLSGGMSLSLLFTLLSAIAGRAGPREGRCRARRRTSRTRGAA
mgnify:CR=1 FL=1